MCDILRKFHCVRVLDMGCGSGSLLGYLVNDARWAGVVDSP